MSSFLSSFEIKKYAVSFLIAFVITAVSVALLSIIFAFLPPPLWLVTGIHNYCAYFSVFIAAFFSARKSRGRGFLTGIIAAVIYMAILLALGGLFFKNTVSLPLLTRIFSLCSLCGAIGGILGINCK